MKQSRNRILNLKDLERQDFKEVNARIQAMQDAEKAACGYHVCHVYPTKRWEYPWAMIEGGPVKDLTVLDAGCGTSPLPCYLALQGAKVYAMDHREKHTVPQKLAAKIHGCDIKTAAMDLAKMDFPDNKFDRVYCISVLEHVSVASQADAAREMARILKPGGKLIISFDIDEKEHAHGNDMIFDRNTMYERFLKPSGLVIKGSTDFSVKDWTAHQQEMNRFTYQPHTSLGLILEKPIERAVRPERGDFLFGMNVPWFNGRYCNDLAVNPYHKEWGYGFDKQQVSAVLEDVAALGFEGVRIWLWENAEGLVLDENSHVMGLRNEFMTSFQFIQDKIASLGLKAYWTLFDGNAITYSGDKAFAALLSDTTARQSFFKNALIPFLQSWNPDACYAVDLINEPEACLSVRENKSAVFAWPQVHGFMEECIGVIRSHSNAFKISCGSGWHGPAFIINGKYEGLDLDMNDFHYYGNTDQLQNSEFVSPILPCNLGEWNPAATEQDESATLSDVFAGLGEIQQLGYQSVFFWHYDAFKKLQGDTATADVRAMLDQLQETKGVYANP